MILCAFSKRRFTAVWSLRVVWCASLRRPLPAVSGGTPSFCLAACSQETSLADALGRRGPSAAHHHTGHSAPPARHVGQLPPGHRTTTSSLVAPQPLQANTHAVRTSAEGALHWIILQQCSGVTTRQQLISSCNVGTHPVLARMKKRVVNRRRRIFLRWWGRRCSLRSSCPAASRKARPPCF